MNQHNNAPPNTPATPIMWKGLRSSCGNLEEQQEAENCRYPNEGAKTRLDCPSGIKNTETNTAIGAENARAL